MFLYISTDSDKAFHYEKTERLQQSDDLLRFISKFIIRQIPESFINWVKLQVTEKLG